MEYATARTLRAERSFSHSHLVATYHHNIDYTNEGVEIQDEKNVHIYEQDCETWDLESVTDSFDLFKHFVGDDRTRPSAGNERS